MFLNWYQKRLAESRNGSPGPSSRHPALLRFSGVLWLCSGIRGDCSQFAIECENRVLGMGRFFRGVKPQYSNHVVIRTHFMYRLDLGCRATDTLVTYFYIYRIHSEAIIAE